MLEEYLGDCRRRYRFRLRRYMKAAHHLVKLGIKGLMEEMHKRRENGEEHIEALATAAPDFEFIPTEETLLHLIERALKSFA